MRLPHGRSGDRLRRSPPAVGEARPERARSRLGQSDHQAFYDIGIPSALFIWLDYRKPASGICGTSGGTYVTEPVYHTPRDGITFKQAIKANDPLRTGAYSKTVTFTPSTTNS